MNSKHVQGIPVISIADGEKIGSVDNVYFNPTTRRVVGFSIGSGAGLLNPEGGNIIDAGNLRSLGPDAMTVPDKAAAQGTSTGAAYADLVLLGDLMKRKVVTEGGTYVGNLVSVDFDERTFGLTEVEVSPGFFKSNQTVPANQITSIGHDVVVVADAVCNPEPGTESSTSGESATSKGSNVEYYPR